MLLLSKKLELLAKGLSTQEIEAIERQLEALSQQADFLQLESKELKGGNSMTIFDLIQGNQEKESNQDYTIADIVLGNGFPEHGRQIQKARAKAANATRSRRYGTVQPVKKEKTGSDLMKVKEALLDRIALGR